MTIEPGSPLPTLDVTMADGSVRNLSDFSGAPFVLYFYPKDDTSGCTREANAFSEALAAFEGEGARVLGMSRDTPEKHRKFIAKHDLTVPLASDTDGAVTETFGVWGEKKLYGRTYMGVERATFLFGADGICTTMWRKVRVPGHVDAVLDAVRALPR